MRERRRDDGPSGRRVDLGVRAPLPIGAGELQWLMGLAKELGFEKVELLMAATEPEMVVALAGRPLRVVDRRPLRSSPLQRVLEVSASVALSEPDGRDAPSLGGPRPARAIAAPVWHDGEVVGAVHATLRAPYGLGAQQRVSIDLVAAQVSAVVQRVADQDRLTRTQAERDRLERLKRDFVRTSSHELRTPLTVLRSTSQTLAKRWDSFDEAARAELLGLMASNASTLEAIVDRLVDTERLEIGFLRPQREVIDVGSIAGSVARRLGPLLTDHRFCLDVEHDLWAEADPMLIDRVVENLLANAAKHTPAGTRVSLVVARSEGTARLTVEDEGPGIAAIDLPLVGTPFFRGDRPDGADQPAGLGLGLALVGEILNAHGSELEIETRRSAGVSVGFHLALTDHLVILDADDLDDVGRASDRMSLN